MSWLQQHASEVYQGILEADRAGLQRNHGHGPALAQVYNHIILPLANLRDKQTQVKWGIYDFEHRFGRKPEGMWLAETAVDTETLEVLADNDIRFTILAPRQARSIKPLHDGVWTDVSAENIDTRRAYLCKLPSGKSISLFFYDGRISEEVAFKRLLDSGEKFSSALMSGFGETFEEAALVHIATDGESYGHHHKHGDMALAYAQELILKHEDITLINYGYFLDLHPPKWEVKIREQSSWSCAHGIERWRADCGCNTGGNPSWNQAWRGPLRDALQELSHRAWEIYAHEIKTYAEDPVALRDDYIRIVLERGEASVNRFMLRHCGKILDKSSRTRFLRLLEMQRHSQLMFTSCGWFFDEVSGIETVQILRYADRVVQLVESETGISLLKDFMLKLHQVPSNLPEYKNAAILYEKEVSPFRLTLGKVGMHYAVASLFADDPESMEICNYRAESEVYERLEAGALKLAVGKTRIESNITFSERLFYFAALYLGQNHIIGNSASVMSDTEFHRMKHEITEAFSESRMADVIGIMQRYFGPDKFSLSNLIRDEQRKILEHIIDRDLHQAEDSYKKIYNRNYNSMMVLQQAALPIPKLLLSNLSTVINNELRSFFQGNILYPARLEKLAREALKWQVEIDRENIAFAANTKMYSLIKELHTRYEDHRFLQMLNRVFSVLHELGIDINLWQIQNEYFNINQHLFDPDAGTCIVVNESNKEWINSFRKLGLHIGVNPLI
jgi:hypothetical protein